MLSFFSMLIHLRIRNFALIEELDLDFSHGLSFFTGETGAGKSILIDAICRLLGARSTQEDVRGGATKSILEAQFDSARLSSHAIELLERWEIEPNDDIIIRREIYSTGKSRSLINNCSVTLSQLKELAPYLVDIFGQNEHQSLLDSNSQRQIFDASIGIDSWTGELSLISKRIRDLQNEWKGFHEQEQQRQRNIDMLQFQVREIEEARISEEEEQNLVTTKKLLQNRERIHHLCDSLLDMILERDESLLSFMKELERGITELQKFREEFLPYTSHIQQWQGDLRDLISQMAALRKNLDMEEGSLDQIETRLDIYHRLKRKYGPALSDVLAHVEKSKSELTGYTNAEEREESLKQELARAASEYDSLCLKISKARSDARQEFERNMEAELCQVAMENCRFRVALTPETDETAELTVARFPASGRESIRFEMEPNRGEGFLDLQRVASGGELSRLMLALKVVCQGKGDASCLIFDEIDSGIGGKVAHQIGARLRKLSLNAQVLCVTHLPQVAAFGDHHFCVTKQEKDARTLTEVRTLDDSQRIRELARMISGSDITETALQHARELRDQIIASAV